MWPLADCLGGEGRKEGGVGGENWGCSHGKSRETKVMNARLASGEQVHLKGVEADHTDNVAV